MVGATSHLISDSLAIRTAPEGHRRTITIPAGSPVLLLEEVLHGKRMIKVEWGGEILLMFADDFNHSETSYLSETRSLDRASLGSPKATESQGREQALIQHSMDLATSNEELERFAFVAAHDLRAPLRAIRTSTELFLRRNGTNFDEDSNILLKQIVTNAGRMNDLITNLLDFALSSSETEHQELDPFTLVERALQLLRGPIKEAGMMVTVEALPTKIVANEEEVVRLFQNLFGNAIKYRNPVSPEVTISTCLKDGNLVFSVKDNGIGIEPVYHQQIFAPFRRLHTQSDYEGSGVGLAICKRIVEKYQGQIWVESQPGSGSNFLFTMPKALVSDSSTDEQPTY